MNIAAVLEENRRRSLALTDHYLPEWGHGSPLPRLAVRWDDDDTKPDLLLPASMFAAPCPAAGVLTWARTYGRTVKEAIAQANLDLKALGKDPVQWEGYEHVFNAERIIHDFEFWAVKCFRVEDKETMRIIPFRLIAPQRASLAAIEMQRIAGQPIRFIELKHRQYGSTSMKAAYLFWLQHVVTGGRHIWAISLQIGGAAEIVRRLQLGVKDIPAWGQPAAFGAVRNNPSTLQVKQTGSLIGVASVNNPQGPTGYTAHLVLVSEAGKMGSTAVQSADRLITNVTSAVPDAPLTAILIESTAEASGAWFKAEVEKARAGTSGYAFHFTSWLSEPGLQRDVPDPAGYVASWSDPENVYGERQRFLWEAGASLEQIAWYTAARKLKGSDWEMMQEFPTSPEEAFQVGERRVFHPLYVAAARRTVREPIMRGRLISDAETEEGAFDGLTFEKDPRGPLSVWIKPGHQFKVLRPERISNRYLGAADTGGVWEGADFSGCTMLDRAPRLVNGDPQIAAELHEHIDPDVFAWDAARLCKWYDDALLVVESNKYDANPAVNELAPDETYTVLDVLGEHYENLYTRAATPEHQYDEPVSRFGLQTNVRTKALMMAALRRWLRHVMEEKEGEGYVERNAAACDEMDSYLFILKGSVMTMGAAPRKKDDRVIQRALLAYVDAEMEPVRYAPAVERPQRAHAGMASV